MKCYLDDDIRVLRNLPHDISYRKLKKAVEKEFKVSVLLQRKDDSGRLSRIENDSDLSRVRGARSVSEPLKLYLQRD